MPDMNTAKKTGRPVGSRSGYAPGWMRKQMLDEMRRRGVKAVTGSLTHKELIDAAIKCEPKDITTHSQVNIKIVSLPALVPEGTAIEPADYKVINSTDTANSIDLIPADSAAAE
jgi:hypothetical protein